VLAAVAILGIVYTLLADWAIQGLMAEGEAQRRLEASLLADRRLSELEATVEAGGVPPLGVTEAEQEGFILKVEVVPLDLALAGLTIEPTRTSGPEQPSAQGQSLLSAGPQGSASLLRRIDVRVSWTEGTSERAVGRTTFAFDRESARPLLEQLDAKALAQSGAAP
jgi:hypothetical protein